MKKSLCAIVIGLFLTLSGGLAYSQQPESTPLPRGGPQGRPGIPMPMPGGLMGRQMEERMGPGGMGMMLQLLRDDPKLAGVDDADARRDDENSRGGNEQDGRRDEAIR